MKVLSGLKAWMAAQSQPHLTVADVSKGPKFTPHSSVQPARTPLPLCFPYIQKCTGEHFLDWIENKQTWQITRSLNGAEAKHDITAPQWVNYIVIATLLCVCTPLIHHQEIVVFSV